MRDSTKLLEFNPNRELQFDPFRKLAINLKRKYTFDPTRKLDFDPNRDLKIRKRGVVFRGYICPTCKASVDADATQCEECGTMFEPVAEEQKKPEKQWERGERKAMAVQSVSIPPPPPEDWSREEQRISLRVCSVCGQLVAEDAVFCSNCGARASEQKRSSTDRYSDSRPSYEPSKQYEGWGRKIQLKKQRDSTVSWEEFQKRNRKYGIVSWDEYSRRKKE